MPVTTAKIQNDHHENYTYVFEPQALNAIKAAVLINRPLLVRGKPGSGKSQLAKAAAAHLKRCFIPYVVSAKTESQNLLWSFDAVARLADVQIEGALCKDEADKENIRKKLALKNYIQPEALWMALNWKSAKEQFELIAESQGQGPESKGYQCRLKRYECPVIPENEDPSSEAKNTPTETIDLSGNGVVVLIDEIDKADSSLPNGLLEVLGSNRFQPEGFDHAIERQSQTDNQPLIIITTNDEHPLPDAFVRRCLVVDVGMPDSNEAEQKAYLVSHAKPNFEKLKSTLVSDEQGNTQNVLEVVADQLINDRKIAKQRNIKPLVGQAEYFDLLRGINSLFKEGDDPENINQWIKSLAAFSSQKGQDSSSKTVSLPTVGGESNGG